MAEPTTVYLFRPEGLVSENRSVKTVCAAPTGLAVAAYGGGGRFEEDGVRSAFGGNAFYRDEETGQTFLAVWGARNASRFRTALRRKATIMLVREPPPARLTWCHRSIDRPPTSAQHGLS